LLQVRQRELLSWLLLVQTLLSLLLLLLLPLQS
jgi:hypothetical protein